MPDTDAAGEGWGHRGLQVAGLEESPTHPQGAEHSDQDCLDDCHNYTECTAVLELQNVGYSEEGGVLECECSAGVEQVVDLLG